MYEIGSLCREQRKREVLTIGRENQRIIRRIVDVEPTFSIPRLERDWSMTMQYLDQISHYPREWWTDEVLNYCNSKRITYIVGQSNTSTDMLILRTSILETLNHSRAICSKLVCIFTSTVQCTKCVRFL